MDRVRSGLQAGLVAGVINIFAILLGLTGLVGMLISEWFGFATQLVGAWFLLLGVALWSGARGARQAQQASWRDALLSGLIAGGIHGVILGACIGLMTSLIQSGVEVRAWLAQMSPEAIQLLSFGLTPVLSGLVAFLAVGLVSALGGGLVRASEVYDWRGSLRSLKERAQERIVSVPAVQRVLEYEHLREILMAGGVLILLVLPLLLDRYWNYTLGTVGIYVILGLGLNIVVGMAGLLHLGYAAFYAIGAYAVAILTAPQFGIELSFWIALPAGILLAVLTGVLLSLPVLRMRGDYLAIVTLGFGEIVRILARSDALTPITGGPRGIRSVAGPVLFGLRLNGVEHFMYFILLGIVAAIFVTARLQRSRLGRAFMAMREDEDVAQAMGIYTLKYKVMAFAISAAFAGFGGVIFASRNRFTGPEDFTLLVSVNVLALVIIGGMNSIPGVVVGALVLKGLPEVLRQLDDYRILAFGALLIVMMILRPEGLLPATRGKREEREAAKRQAKDERVAEVVS